MRLSLYINSGNRGKAVRLSTWHHVERDECEEILKGFFESNSHIEHLKRECVAHWRLEDRVMLG
jgi:hypothetical protein